MFADWRHVVTLGRGGVGRGGGHGRSPRLIVPSRLGVRLSKADLAGGAAGDEKTEFAELTVLPEATEPRSSR
jgi:hypothetical protein